jgi:hypothetical protein
MKLYTIRPLLEGDSKPTRYKGKGCPVYYKPATRDYGYIYCNTLV